MTDHHGGVRSTTPQIKLMHVCTLNVRTLIGEARMWELENAINSIKWDIIGLSEVRRNNDCCEERKSGNILCHSAGITGNYGVGFLIKKEHRDNILEFIPHNERIATLTMDTNSGRILKIVQVYAPTENSTQEEIEQIYEKLFEIISKFSRKSEVLIMGDFNSRVGAAIPGEERTIGKYYFGERNDRGQMLIDFASSLNFKVGNIFFGKQKMNTRWTWESPTGFKAELDYILYKNNEYVQNIEIIQSIKFNTDHRMVRATIKLVNKRKRPYINNNKTYKIEEEQSQE